MAVERRKRNAKARGGAVAIELLFALPVVAALLFAMIEFSTLLVVRQQLLAASREGTRLASQGGTVAEVEQATRLFLGSGSLSQAVIDVFITDDLGNPVLSGEPVA